MFNLFGVIGNIFSRAASGAKKLFFGEEKTTFTGHNPSEFQNEYLTEVKTTVSHNTTSLQNRSVKTNTTSGLTDYNRYKNTTTKPTIVF